VEHKFSLPSNVKLAPGVTRTISYSYIMPVLNDAHKGMEYPFEFLVAQCSENDLKRMREKAENRNLRTKKEEKEKALKADSGEVLKIGDSVLCIVRGRQDVHSKVTRIYYVLFQKNNGDYSEKAMLEKFLERTILLSQRNSLVKIYEKPAAKNK